MIPRILLSAFASILTNRAQILVALTGLAFAIAMLPDFGILVWGNHGFGSSGINLV